LRVSHPSTTPYPKSFSRLTSFSYLPIFPSSHLPSLFPGRRRQWKKVPGKEQVVHLFSSPQA
jgi:hypothetical protein